jgi:thioesterase domain-containing protein
VSSVAAHTAPGGQVASSVLFSRASRNSSKVILPLNESAVHADDSRPKLYCVHPISGAITDFVVLARLLEPEVQVFGIQAPPKKMLEPDFANSIESMAQQYVEALTAFQPEGAVALAGWSVGVVIALEMAARLKAAGRKVSLLVALDGAPKNTGAGISSWNPRYTYELLLNLPKWLVSEELLKKGAAWFLVRRTWNKVVGLFKASMSRLQGTVADSGQAVDGFMDRTRYPPAYMLFMRSLFAAGERYVAQPYYGRVVLYEANTQPLYRLHQFGAIWRKVADSVDVVKVEGSHKSIVETPHVVPLIVDLRARLLAASDGQIP